MTKFIVVRFPSGRELHALYLGEPDPLVPDLEQPSALILSDDKAYLDHVAQFLNEVPVAGNLFRDRQHNSTIWL